MASARIASAKERSKRYEAFYKFQGGRRVLSLSSKTSSISGKVEDAEDLDMINRYEDGLVSNDDYLKYLSNTVLKRSGLSDKDRSEVLNAIRDTRKQIEIEELETVYQGAPERTTERATAAQAIAQYFQKMADEIIPGTPAHSIAMQNAAKWGAQATTIQDSSEKDLRTMFRTQKEMEISALTDDDSEVTAEKGNMFYDLAQQAANDGDMLDAQKFQKLGNDAYEKAQELQEKEVRTEALKEMVNIEVGWHDGTISYEDAMQQLAGLNGFAIETGDVNLMDSIRGLGDRIAKDQEAGGLDRANEFGLPVVLGRGGTGEGDVDTQLSSGRSTFESELDYVEKLRQIDARVKNGEINSDEARVLQTKAMTDRYQELVELQQHAEAAIETEGAGAKIAYKGRKVLARTVVEDVKGELRADATKPLAGLTETQILPRGLGLEQLLEADMELARAIIDGYEVGDLTPEQVSELTSIKADGNFIKVVSTDPNTGEKFIKRIDKNSPDYIPGSYIAFGGEDAALHLELLNPYYMQGLTFSTPEEAAAYNDHHFKGKGEVVEGEGGSYKISINYVESPDGEKWYQNQASGLLEPLDDEFNAAFQGVRGASPDSLLENTIYSREDVQRFIPEGGFAPEAIGQGKPIMDYVSAPGAESLFDVAPRLDPAIWGEKVRPAIEHAVQPIKDFVAPMAQQIEKASPTLSGLFSGGVSLQPQQLESIKSAVRPAIQKYTPGLQSPQDFTQSFKQNIFTPGPGEGALESSVRGGVQKLGKTGKDIWNKLTPSWLTPSWMK